MPAIHLNRVETAKLSAVPALCGTTRLDVCPVLRRSAYQMTSTLERAVLSRGLDDIIQLAEVVSVARFDWVFVSIWTCSPPSKTACAHSLARSSPLLATWMVVGLLW